MSVLESSLLYKLINKIFKNLRLTVYETLLSVLRSLAIVISPELLSREKKVGAGTTPSVA